VEQVSHVLEEGARRVAADRKTGLQEVLELSKQERNNLASLHMVSLTMYEHIETYQ
jgi:hypothetical protein